MSTASERMTVWGRARAKFVEVFGADLRSLAAFRIAIALVVLADLAIRATDLTAHYTDAGVLPRSSLVEDPRLLSPYAWSIHLLNGQTAFQALLFGVAAVAAVAMLVGYRTRLATFVVWALVLSVQHRNMLGVNAGDILLHALLFWSLFLPLGAVWSVDRRSRERARQGGASRPLSMRFFSAATVALFLQIALVYWFTALLKTGGDWREDGTALYFTFANDQVTTQLGSYLLNFPTLLTLLTFGTLAFEALGPFLLFSPIFNGLARILGVLAFVGLHFGIWLTMEVGLFPFVSAFCMVCFLPGSFWDRVLPRLGESLPVRGGFARRLQRLRGATARSFQAYLSPLRSRLSPATGSPTAVVGLTPYGDRPAAGGSTSTEPAPEPKPETPGGESRAVVLRSSLATNLAALFFLFYVFCWNVTTVTPLTMPTTPGYALGPFLGLYQNWIMFAPNPPKDDGWWVLPGNLENGQQVDLMSVVRGDFDMREVSYDKPDNIIASTYQNEHWHKYLEFLTTLEDVQDTPQLRSARVVEQREQRENLGDYLCSAWNERHAGGERLEDVQIVYMREMSLADLRTPEVERTVLRDHSCR